MNLYTLLGLTPDASDADIERAYRRLSRRYHPGVNPGDRVAAQMYEQIQEAYRVLGDAARRGDYDRGAGSSDPDPVDRAIAFEGFDFSAAADGPLAATFSELFADVFQQAARSATVAAPGSDIAVTLRVPFVDAVRGADVPISLTRHEHCTACSGTGRQARAEMPCPGCAGAGTRRWTRGHMVFTKICDACAGEGRLASMPCRHCRGEGIAPRHEVVTVRVPAGIESGARLSIPGRGHAGLRGGVPGHLYVTVEVDAHPFFRREGRDIALTLPVQVHEAALGAVVDVPTPGGIVAMRIPAGTSSGRRLRLRDHGVNDTSGREEAAGDLIVDVQIVLPPVLDETSVELMKEFGRRHPQDVRRAWFESR